MEMSNIYLFFFCRNIYIYIYIWKININRSKNIVKKKLNFLMHIIYFYDISVHYKNIIFSMFFYFYFLSFEEKNILL